MARKTGVPTIKVKKSTKTTTDAPQPALSGATIETVAHPEPATVPFAYSPGVIQTQAHGEWKVKMKTFERRETRELIVTPEDAKRFTSCMYWNMREVAPMTQVDYCRIIEQGCWGEGVVELRFVVYEGREYLVDGQHRLNALIENNETMLFYAVYYHCSTEKQVKNLYTILDNGRRRTRNENLLSSGAVEEFELPKCKIQSANAAINFIYRRFGRGSNRLEGEAWEYSKNSLKQWDIFRDEWGDAVRGYFDAVHDAYPELTRRGAPLSSTTVIAVGLLTFRADPQKAYPFWNCIGKYQKLDEGDARAATVRYLLANDMSKNGIEPAHMHARAIFSGWRAFCENRELGALRVQRKREVKVFGYDYQV